MISIKDLEKLIESVVRKCLLDYEFKGEKQDKLLKIEEVCELLKVSKSTVHHWKQQGLIPFHRIGNRVFFKRSEVLASVVASKHLG